MRSFLFYCLIAITLGSCIQGPEQCDYEIFEVKARVKSIEALNNEEGPKQPFKVMIEFMGSPLADKDQDLSDFLDREVNLDFLAQNQIIVGMKLPSTVSILKSGDCTPQMVTFQRKFR